MRHRLYIDESGDHTSSDATHIGKRYLGLVGVAFDRKQYEAFQSDLEAFKKDHLDYDPDDPPVLHRYDILHRLKAFRVLRDAEKKRRFDEGVLSLISSARYWIIAVVLDKFEHDQKTYRLLNHPYHYCLHALMERYCGRLGHQGYEGDVMAEVRGKNEDQALKEEYRTVWRTGTQYMSASDAQKVLTSKELKLKPKKSNVTGLQLADILAHPLTRDVLLEYGRTIRNTEFADRIRDAVQSRYNEKFFTGRLRGYGKILLT